MSWRANARQTGANSAELSAPRRWGSGSASPAPPLASAPPPPPSRDAIEPPADGPRKRRSRWGTEAEKVNLAGLPTAISSNVKSNELEGYAITLRLDEIGRKLRTGDVVPEERMRSPSPPPAYDSHGRRTNTREVRYKRKLEDERQRLIEKAMKLDPNYRPPADYYQHRRSGRPQEKVYIPVKEFPEINFFGLLVGPRGNSLKTMERNSGAKISIRGKGSVKEGKQRPDGFNNDDDEELHCLVVADHEDKVRKCVELINHVIETAASTPESANDHKRNQLRELASLNGTLRDDENQPCQNCGKIGHRKWDCTEERNYTANIICRSCGGAGHMARDCLKARDPNGAQQSQAFDNEYASLMAELGEGPKEGQAPPQPVSVPPWREPSNWHAPSLPTERPPRPHYQGYGGGHSYNNYGGAGSGANTYGGGGGGGYQQHGYGGGGYGGGGGGGYGGYGRGGGGGYGGY